MVRYSGNTYFNVRTLLVFSTITPDCAVYLCIISRGLKYFAVVLVTTKMAASVLKKYISAKTEGTLLEQLGDGKYLVEFETDQGNLQF